MSLSAPFVLSVVVLVLLGAAAAVRQGEHENRVVGGSPANIEQFPHQVSLEYFRVHLCGGSIINSQWVLTAAHCIYGNEILNMRARAGSSVRETGGSVHDAKSAKIHPSYKSCQSDFDVALVSVAPAFSWSSAVRPASLPPVSTRDLPVNSVVTVTGWGYTTASPGNSAARSRIMKTSSCRSVLRSSLVQRSSTGQMSSQLQKAQLRSVSRPVCNAAYSNTLTSRMMCAAAPGKDACKYDSGGPLVDGSGYLVGVVAFGKGCADPKYPGVYMNLYNSDLRNFIARVAS